MKAIDVVLLVMAPSPLRCKSRLLICSRLREEHDMAQTLLQQHSSWLRGFREQVGRVSASNSAGGGGAPSVQSGFRGGMQGFAPSAPLNRGSIPMRIPIGNNQEVVVTVQQKF
jgi:hypothetical protein